MRTLMKKATLAVALGASAIVASAPADAQWRGRYYDRHHRGNGGAAVVAGIAGLAIGAAIASNNRYDRRYAYDYDYYDRRGYFPNDGYYARSYYDRGYYDRCYTRRVYDPYIRRPVRVRYCD